MRVRQIKRAVSICTFFVGRQWVISKCAYFIRRRTQDFGLGKFTVIIYEQSVCSVVSKMKTTLKKLWSQTSDDQFKINCNVTKRETFPRFRRHWVLMFINHV